MRNLISMTDFVISMRENKDKDNIRKFWACERYVKFLKQPLELWMFVPCDEDGNVLEEINEDYPNNVEYDEELQEYQQAKERCLFDGFEVLENSDEEKVVLGDYTCLKISDLENLDVEYLTKYTHIKLTQTAIKQLGL